MLSKEKFEEALLAFKKQMDIDISFAEKMEELFPNNYAENMMYNNNVIINAFINVLEIVMNDTEKWINYFIYELDFGKENYRLQVYDADDKEIPLSTVEDLYNLLTEKK